jgi:predicted Zn-dependent protease
MQSPSRRLRVSSLLAGLLLLAACAVNPESGRREVILMSEEKEKKIDEEAAKQVEAEIGLVEDPELTAYVEALGEKLASYSLRRDVDYVFNVVEMEEPNAFALPGGHIYVSRGLLELSNSEAELAGVIAHEIAHVSPRHAAQRDTRAKATTILTVLGAVAAAAAGAVDVAAGIGQFGGLAGAGMLAAYGREQEREADRIGLDIVVQAGVDPRGLPAFLRSLENRARLELGASRLPGFFDTHPATPERVAETATRAEVTRWTPDFSIAPSRAAYLEKLDGLVIGRPASEGVFQEDRLVHVDLGFSLRFPSGWLRQNRRSQVVGISPRRDAVVVLELQGAGDDPREAAADYGRKQGIRFIEANDFKIGDLDAFRVRAVANTPYGPANSEITWIAHRGRVYRLTAGAPRTSFLKYEGTFRSFARSFREIQDEERAKVEELRLRVAVAKQSETLAELSRRTENQWSLNQTAVANGLVIGQALEEGQLVKVASREPYRPSREADPAEDPRSEEGEDAAETEAATETEGEQGSGGTPLANRRGKPAPLRHPRGAEAGQGPF